MPYATGRDRTRRVPSAGRVSARIRTQEVYMELGSYFLFLQEQIKDIIIIIGHEGYKYYVGLLEGAAGGRGGRSRPVIIA